MLKVIKKADIVLFLILAALGIAVTVMSLNGAEDGSVVQVSVDGKTYGVYSLNKNQTIEIKQDKSINKITIKDGQVQMSASSCKNQICVKEGSVSKTNQSILCLPNKVMVEITGEEADFDAISN